ncbi:MAG: DUF2281 domain-containing protein [Leptolyngbya sp.]|jgi:ERCC4-type nuclease|uniref:DUF2281 domain-containing protein n=1 Tax=Shackletoniella antarctica TaxID=268115 RepID=A0A2W4VUC1_9CYAN|nr:MAG: DUF2281 domain-containing protein [Shackletoniella antarctica]PZV12580.1 MAG: DUF2281 domain-containing protein [Leptolyngbya sp.]
MTIATATLKEQILAELDHLPEAALVETLAYVQSLSGNLQMASPEEAMQAYLASEKEHEEVYTRLANS